MWERVQIVWPTNLLTWWSKRRASCAALTCYFCVYCFVVVVVVGAQASIRVWSLELVAQDGGHGQALLHARPSLGSAPLRCRCRHRFPAGAQEGQSAEAQQRRGARQGRYHRPQRRIQVGLIAATTVLFQAPPSSWCLCWRSPESQFLSSWLSLLPCVTFQSKGADRRRRGHLCPLDGVVIEILSCKSAVSVLRFRACLSYLRVSYLWEFTLSKCECDEFIP